MIWDWQIINLPFSICKCICNPIPFSRATTHYKMCITLSRLSFHVNLSPFNTILLLLLSINKLASTDIFPRQIHISNVQYLVFQFLLQLGSHHHQLISNSIRSERPKWEKISICVSISLLILDALPYLSGWASNSNPILSHLISYHSKGFCVCLTSHFTYRTQVKSSPLTSPHYMEMKGTGSHTLRQLLMSCSHSTSNILDGFINGRHTKQWWHGMAMAWALTRVLKSFCLAIILHLSLNSTRLNPTPKTPDLSLRFLCKLKVELEWNHHRKVHNPCYV